MSSNIHPLSILSAKRAFFSLGSLPRSKIIGNCGVTIGFSMLSLNRSHILMLCHLTDISDPSGPKNRRDSRPVVLLSPSRNLEASMPSIGRSVGTLSEAPARAANVLYQSWADSISSETTPAGTLPGHRAIAGTRIQPSVGGVKKSPRQGPFEPPNPLDGTQRAALSLQNTINVLSAIPAASTQSTICPTRWSISAIRSAYKPMRVGSV